MNKNGIPLRAPVVMVKGRNSQFERLQSTVEKAKLKSAILESGEAFFQLLTDHRPSLVLLDLTLDSGDAIDIIRELDHLGIREQMTVVVFGERDEHYVEIAALNAGADDYLVKPVNKRVFAGRLNSWMRKQLLIEASVAGGPSTNGAFNLDRESYSLVVRDKAVSLQRKEFEIISLLASKPRKVFSRKEIKETVWGDPDGARNRTIDVHITNLRAKIGSDFIRTYKGVGYSFDG
ncbi:MAG: response regulator transcription factor [Cryomorphaceae bacterium]|nr:response regulator transcription factor [Flavobacteriales bacterium]